MDELLSLRRLRFESLKCKAEEVLKVFHYRNFRKEQVGGIRIFMTREVTWRIFL